MFISVLDKLLCDNGVTIAKLLEECKIGKNQYTYWKKNNNIPNGATLQKIADYFGVTVDYLVSGEERTESTLSENEKALLELFRKIPQEKQEMALRMIEAALKSQ